VPHESAGDDREHVPRLIGVLADGVVFDEARQLFVGVSVDGLIALFERGKQEAAVADLIEEPLADAEASVGDLGVGPMIVNEAPVALDGFCCFLRLVIGVGEPQLGEPGVPAVAVLLLHLFEEPPGFFPVVVLERDHRLFVGVLGVLRIVQGTAPLGRTPTASERANEGDEEGNEYPSGQKMLLVDDEEIPFLEVRSLKFEQPATQATAD